MNRAITRNLKLIMNQLQKISLLSFTILFSSFFLISCSKDNFDKIPKTGFVKNYKHDKNNRTPFLSFWSNESEKEWNARISGDKGSKQLLYVQDINISYMDHKPKTLEEKKDLDKLKDYFKESLVAHLKEEEKKNSNFILSDRKTSDCYSLETAITSITPTNIKANVLSMGLGSVKSGSDLLIKPFTKVGHIAIAGKLWDKNGNLIAEMADYEKDHPSVLGVDLKNFKKYAHHKKNIDIWCDEFTKILTSPTDKKIKRKKFFLTPF